MTKILAPGEGMVYPLMGDEMNFKLTGEESQRAYTLIEDTLNLVLRCLYICTAVIPKSSMSWKEKWSLPSLRKP